MMQPDGRTRTRVPRRVWDNVLRVRLPPSPIVVCHPTTQPPSTGSRLSRTMKQLAGSHCIFGTRVGVTTACGDASTFGFR